MRLLKTTSIHVIFPLIIGGLIYISFRSLSLRLFSWCELTGINTFTTFVRNSTYPIKTYLPSWIYFSLPDGLWAYAFSSSLIIVWGDQFEKNKYWLLIPFLLVTIIEFGQALKIFSGTFDILDFTFSILALSLSIIIVKPKIIKNEKQIF